MAVEKQRELQEQERLKTREESIRDEVGSGKKPERVVYYQEVPIMGVKMNLAMIYFKDENGNENCIAYHGKEEIGKGSIDGKSLEIDPKYLNEISKILEEQNIMRLYPQSEYQIPQEELEQYRGKEMKFEDLQQGNKEQEQQKTEDPKDTVQNEMETKKEEQINQSGEEIGLDMTHKVDITGYDDGLKALGVQQDSEFDKIYIAYSSKDGGRAVAVGVKDGVVYPIPNQETGIVMDNGKYAIRCLGTNGIVTVGMNNAGGVEVEAMYPYPDEPKDMKRSRYEPESRTTTEIDLEEQEKELEKIEETDATASDEPEEEKEEDEEEDKGWERGDRTPWWY